MAFEKVVVPGYSNAKVVCQTGEFVVYRAQSRDNRQVLLKVPASSHPPVKAIHQLEHEHEAARGLDPAFAIRPLWIERGAGNIALVLEGFAGRPLAASLNAPLDLAQFFGIAAGTVKALAATHRHGLVHKDIKPDNIFLHVAADGSIQVKLTGFGVASRQPRERQAPNPPKTIDGTLAYMAPEQTGRVNRSIDARSDLYSLGVTFYQMLAGRLPFTASDPMELVHCHIALQAQPPGEHNPAIPGTLSAIVMKLLAKSPEDRYQTAEGLNADLGLCAAEWQAQGSIEPFALGVHDIPSHLMIPEKLYGREREANLLLAAFECMAATGKPELVLVSGYSGIGKSSVVNELHKALVSPRALFAEGKFDQFKRDIPYATLAQALQSLVRQILCRSEEEIAQWQKVVREAVGPNGQLVAGLIPDLEALIGEQPPVEEVSPQEEENRFRIVLRRLLGAFARPEHPLVLFLDDLQWLDTATVQFLEHLILHPEVNNLLLIGAYRDNETGPAHPLMLAIDAIRKGGASVQQIILSPLAEDIAVQLAADAFRCDVKRAGPLARLVHAKTGGNPFFMIQFLTALVEEGLAVFDSGTASWQWNLDRIRGKGFTDNVADLLISKLSRLQPAVQEAMKQLACLGNRAKIAVLAHVEGKTAEAVERDLQDAIQAGFVLQEEDSVRFVHDRVQEAAYLLVPESERPRIHLNIGRKLLSQAAPEELDGILFDAVNHLNRGAALMTDAAEKAKLADLNAAAGKRARSSIAYSAARDHFATAAGLLPQETWESRYEFQFALHLDWAEAEYLRGGFEEAEALFELLLARAKSDLDKAKIYALKLEVYQVAGKYDAAVDMGIEALRLFGVEIPEDGEALGRAIQAEAAAATANLQGRNTEELASAPEATDPQAVAIIGLISNMAAAAYIGSRPQLYPLVILKSVNYTLKYGPTAASSYAYSGYGIILTSLFGTPYSGYAFSEAAIKLSERFKAVSLRAISLFLHGHMINFWLKPIGTDFPFLEKGFLLCLDSGNLAVANYIAHGIVWQAMERGDALASVIEFSGKYTSFALSSGNNAVYQTIRLQQEVMKHLMGSRQGETCPSNFDEVSVLEKLASTSFTTGISCYHTLKLFAAYLMGDAEGSRVHAEEAKKALMGMLCTPPEATFHFLNALALARTYRNNPKANRDEILETLEDYETKFGFWAEDCPDNFACKHALVSAEIAQIKGDEAQAERLFEQAVASAKASGFIHWEAMTNEAAARFHRQRGLQTIARAYLQEARYCYWRWGAQTKVQQLETAHPWLLEEGQLERSSGAPAAQLDMMAIIKAQQAISGEIVPERLAETLLRIVMENAGARKGYLFAIPKWELFAVAGTGGQIEFHHAPAATFSGAAISILNYVRRTQKLIYLADASTDAGDFSTDEHLVQAKPKSVLCLPILRHAKLVGLLYLENDLVAGAFTPERRTVLELLAAQAAISLENAQTYQALRESESKYSRMVNTSNEGIVVLGTDARITFANPRMAEILGYTAEEMRGRPPTDFMFEEDAAGYNQRMENRRKGSAEHYECHYRRKDGESVWVLISATPIFDDEHRFRGSFAMVADITGRKRFEADILHLYREQEERAAQRAEALEQLDKELAAFSHSVSQGLRAPLDAIDSSSRILIEHYGSALDEQGKQHLHAVRASAGDMGRLIDDIAASSQRTRGHLDGKGAAAPVPKVAAE